jgi:hypothetical protein
MIEYRQTRPGHSGPMIICDKCGGVIRGHGNVILPDEGPGPVKFFHKGCDKQIHRRWVELERFILLLVHNSGADLEEAERAGELFEAMEG